MKFANQLTMILYSFFIILIVFNSSDACLCRRTTVEQYLNHSDYSCTFKILEKNEKPELHSIYYKVQKKLECEKMNENAELLLGSNVTEPIIIRTSNQESICGINLTVDNTYHIMGQVTNDEMLTVFLCNYVKQIDPPLP